MEVQEMVLEIKYVRKTKDVMKLKIVHEEKERRRTSWTWKRR